MRRRSVSWGQPDLVGRLVEERLAGLNFTKKVREHTAPLVWAEVVGPQVAGATEVIGLRDGVLIVSTRSAVWSNELTFYKIDILRRINERVGAPERDPAITDILFQNRGLRNEQPEAPPPALAPTPEELDDIPLSPQETETIEAGLTGVVDEALRDRLRRIRISDARLRTWRLDRGWLPCPRCGDLAPPQQEHPGVADCSRCRIGPIGPRG